MLGNKDSPEDPRPSIDADSSQSKKCYICSKGFNFRKRHTCRFCLNSVCGDHCQKARAKEQYEEPQPICDLCNQEEIKKELLSEVQIEIESLEEELKAAKFTNDRLEREHFEKTAVISKLESDLEESTNSHNLSMRSLNKELEEEEKFNKEIRVTHVQVKAELNDLQKEEARTEEELQKAQENLENLRRQSEILKETKDNLNSQLDKINAKLKGSLSLEKVEKLLCQPCAEKLNESNSRRNEAPSILEDGTVSISVADERQSIMQSVREYKEILSQQSLRPSEPGKCLII